MSLDAERLAKQDEMLIDAGIDRDAPIDEKRLPLPLKVFGVLCILAGLSTLPGIVFDALGAVRLFREGAFNQEALSPMVVSAVFLVLLGALCVYAILYGIHLLRNRRRTAALASSILILLAVCALVCSIMLFGVSFRIVHVGIALALFIALNSYIDPSLAEERELQRRLRDMEVREAAEDGTLGRDETGRGYITLNFFNVFWIFIVCSVIGLVGETIYHAVVFGGYEDRAGLLFGPFSPIYGVGAVLMTVALNHFYRANVVVVFLVSAVIGGAFEFFVSWFMEVAFGAVAWDYTGTFLSIGGRTNAYFMCIWGLAGVVWIKLLLPQVLKLVNLIPWNWRYALTTVCAVLMVLDAVMTLQALDCWSVRMAGKEPTTAIESFYAQHFDDETMQGRFQNMSIIPENAARSVAPPPEDLLGA